MPYTVSPAGNQATYQDVQPYQIDIDQIYTDFIQQIDAVRSYVNVNNATIDKKVINSLSGGSDQSVINFLTPNNNHQESRCHAFFRLVGLPVCSQQFKIYNPGHPLNGISQNNTANQVTLKYKLQIAGNQLTDFRAFSIAREQYPLTNATIFATTGSIDAAVLALSSGSGSANQAVNIRQLDYSKVSGNPFDVKIQDQTFKVGAQSLVGFNQIALTAYQDLNGKMPDANVNLTSRAHLIFPLITDPIIELCVNPSSRKVGLPFVPDKTYLKIAASTYVVRPLLEKVIRDQYNTTNPDTTLQPAQVDLINAVKNNPLLNSIQAISQVFGNNDLYSLSSQAQFANFVNIVDAMMKQLTNSLINIHQAQSLYYWVPTMSSIGPEGGVTVTPPYLPNNISTTLITQKDRNLLNKIIQAGLNQFNQQASQAQGIPDLGGFAFESFKTTFNSDTSSAFVDGNQSSVDNMTAERTTVLNKAGSALRTIEIIMGEFSGLGLIDIIAIMGGLYLMKPSNLLGLLDSDAYIRAKSSLGTNSAFPTTQPTYQTAMTDLQNSVISYYSIANSILVNWLNSQALSI